MVTRARNDAAVSSQPQHTVTDSYRLLWPKTFGRTSTHHANQGDDVHRGSRAFARESKPSRSQRLKRLDSFHCAFVMSSSNPTQTFSASPPTDTQVIRFQDQVIEYTGQWTGGAVNNLNETSTLYYVTTGKTASFALKFFGELVFYLRKFFLLLEFA